MPSVNGMDPDESSSAALNVPPEVGIIQVCESDNVSNYRSCQFPTELILYLIKYPEGGMQEIPTPKQVASYQSMRH